MHRILLSTTALISIAGAASAEITWSGKVELGYNTEEQVEDGKGVIATAEISPTFSTDLDFGLTAKAEATFILIDQEGGGGLDTDALDDFEAESYILSLSNDDFALEFGTTDFAPDSYWESAGDMEADGFSEADGETGVLFSGTYGPMSFGLSSVLHTDDFADGGAGEGEFDQLALAVNADMDKFDVSFAYQEEANLAFDGNDDFEADEIIAASVGTTLQGIDLRLGYASNQTDNIDSTGIEVGYAIQDVSLGGYFVSESAGNDNWGLSAGYERGPLAVEVYYEDEQGSSLAGLEGAYEVNERLVVKAGFIDDEDANDDGGTYIGAEYDLGNDASFLLSFADADAEDEDELGGPEYRNGVTALLTLEF
ncbi:porin [Rhodobacteraceae bacterium 63075]|nr:porin [Rhodobacteraceae bacterium 63075]